MASDRAQILITAVDQTRQAFASVKGSLETLSGAASKVNGLLAGLGAALSMGALLAVAKAAVDSADELSKLAQKTGLSVESLSLLKPIAEQSGVSLEGLAKGLQKLATSMFDAAGGSKEQTDAFKSLGVSATDTAGQLRPTEEVLLDLAQAFSRMPDGAHKSALAVKLLGKSGVELIPFLNQGRAGIEQLKLKFRELGLEISGETASAAENFNDTLDTVQQALSGIAMKIAQAALPALQALAEGLVSVASHSQEILSVLKTLGELIVAVLAVRGVAAVSALGGALAVLKTAFMRFMPILLAVGLWKIGSGIVSMVQDIGEFNRTVEQMARERAQVQQMDAALQELASSGTLSVKTQMWLAAQAAERFKAALPGAEAALRAIQGAATQVGQAIQLAIDGETKKASETVKQLSAGYRQTAADIKAIWGARTAEVEANYKREEAAAQSAGRSESAAIRQSAQALLAAEQQKTAAVQDAATQMQAAWSATYSAAIALARAAGQDVQAIERQSVDARIALLGQFESAYRGTVDRLIAQEQRHLNAARAAEEARLNLRLSIEDRIRELARKGMDEQAAYQDRQRQVEEKQAQARAALAAGNYEQARKLAEEAIALSERSASAVTRQVEQNGKTVTQTIISDAQAASTAIGQIKASADIADAALQGLGDAHKQAAAAAGAGADEAKRALAAVSGEIAQLRTELLAQDKIKLEVDIESAKSGIATLKTLAEAQTLVATISVDSQGVIDAIAQLKANTADLTLVAKVQANTSQVITDIDALKGALSSAGISIPALASFDQPRQQMALFAQDAKMVLAAPTAAVHTVKPELGAYRSAMAELLRPTSSTHTVYVRKVQTNAQGGLIQRLAQGGQALSAVTDGFKRMSARIAGPGTETSDSVPALLSRGEYVIRAASVRHFGENFFNALNAGFMPRVPRFATGGFVGNAVSQMAKAASEQAGPARDVIDVRLNVAGKTHTVQSSRATAMQLAQALREISRGA